MKSLSIQKKPVSLHRLKRHAQMAESVDALVSNTSGATRAGSTPALGTVKTAKQLRIQRLAVFFFLHPSTAPAPAKRNLVKNSSFSWRNKIFLILLQKTG